MTAHVLHIRQEESRPEWAACISAQLEEVETRLEDAVSSQVVQAFDLSFHLLAAGGKRIRPALVLLSSLACGAASIGRGANLAAVTELVHMASLLHDDVVDETRERRGMPTANAKWGNKLSVLGGDFLLSKAFSLLASDGDADVFRILSTRAVEMTESEVLQATSEGRLSAWEALYWQIIEGKTAGLMSACCECGAVVGGASKQTSRALAEYGRLVGLAFQITDDLLDIAGDPAQTGKEVGMDLIQGKFTLPVLLAARGDDPEARRLILAAAGSGHFSREEALDVAEVVIGSGAVDAAREVAMDHANKATAELDALPPSDYVDSLRSVASFVVGRQA